MLADLNMNTHKIKNLANGTLTNEAINLGQLYGVSSVAKIYSDSVSTSSFIYANSISSSSSLYTSSQSSLKVNKSGDTMTDYLATPEIRLIGQTTTFNDTFADLANRTNTYISFEPNGSSNDWAYLRQIGGSNNIHFALDFHNDNGEENLV